MFDSERKSVAKKLLMEYSNGAFPVRISIMLNMHAVPLFLPYEKVSMKNILTQVLNSDKKSSYEKEGDGRTLPHPARTPTPVRPSPYTLF